MLTPEKLSSIHSGLLGTGPEVSHLRLYNAVPRGFRGFSDRTPNVKRFEATALLALAQTWRLGAEAGPPQQVYFIVPAQQEPWALTELERIARLIFDRLRGKPSAAKHIGELFHQVYMGFKAFHLETAPERWAAFGFNRMDPMPSWMQEGLLSAKD